MIFTDNFAASFGSHFYAPPTVSTLRCTIPVFGRCGVRIDFDNDSKNCECHLWWLPLSRRAIWRFSHWPDESTKSDPGPTTLTLLWSPMSKPPAWSVTGVPCNCHHIFKTCLLFLFWNGCAANTELGIEEFSDIDSAWRLSTTHRAASTNFWLLNVLVLETFSQSFHKTGHHAPILIVDARAHLSI